MTGDEKVSTHPANPLCTASLWSRLTFWWLRGLFCAGLQQPLDQQHLYETLPEDGSAKLVTFFEQKWHEELAASTEAGSPSLFRVIARIYWFKIVPLGFVCYVLDIACRLFLPQCLGVLVAYFTPDAQIPPASAYLAASGLIVCSLVMAFSLQSVYMYFFRLGMRLRITCTSLVYRKALRLRAGSTPSGLAAHVLNLMATDVTRFNTALVMIHDLWRGPVELLLMGTAIYRTIGASGVLGLTVMVAFLPLQAWASQRTAVYRKRSAAHADARLRIVDEVVQAMQVIKMYTWERWFAKRVQEARERELRGVRGTLLVAGFLSSTKILSRVAIFVALTVFASGQQESLTASQVFVVTTYFGYIYASLFNNWSMAWSALAQTRVSIGRVERFLLLPEGEPQLPEKPTVLEATKGITVRNVSASWPSDTSTGLRNVNLRVRERSLHVIIGAVGAGKSTLLQVILGELVAKSGSVQVQGTVSYASQDTWLFSGTIRENIVFMEAYDEKRYDQVIAACALLADFDSLPAGDRTAVGERGICLSGGQRARINLARAIYRQADIYLLDDPLSAVDAAVGQHIFTKCIEGLLEEKICVLVTHQLQYLRNVRHCVLMEGGEIAALGTFAKLRESQAYAILESIPERRPSYLEKPTVDLETIDGGDAVPLNAAEVNVIGCVGSTYYHSYFKAVKSNVLVLIVGFLFLMAQISSSAVDIFVASWASPKDNSTKHMEIYCGLVALVVITAAFRVVLFFGMSLRASRNLHKQLYKGITQTGMWFFKQNASGRILNRFSRDMDNVDTVLPVAFNGVLTFVLEMLAVVLLVVLSNWWLLLPTAALAALFYLIRFVYMQTSRSIKRIEASTLSPMFSHTNASLQGATTIRAFGAQLQFENQFDGHQDRNTSARFLFLATNQAFALWLELATVMYLAAVVGSFISLTQATDLGGRVGLAITQILNLTMMCKSGMRHSAILENQMISIERLCEYAELPAEEQSTGRKQNKEEPCQLWPQSGTISFDKVSLHYANKSQSAALQQVSFRIEAREKIGIVGRTGAGKSSIIAALFQLAPTEGTICIDTLNTSAMSLQRLRSSISIIPQEAVLFGGTMRTNLDPFARHADAELWAALEQVELRSMVAAMRGGLDAEVCGGGINFSSGQRQLVCLARAILSRNRILILDEATANVDAETDRQIQRSIRECFADCTVLTIAHRLQTIVGSDRVLVMDGGRVVEFGRPCELSLISGGHFSRMCARSGVRIGDE